MQGARRQVIIGRSGQLDAMSWAAGAVPPQFPLCLKEAAEPIAKSTILEGVIVSHADPPEGVLVTHARRAVP